MKLLRILGYVLGALVLIAAVGALAVYVRSQRMLTSAEARPLHLARPTPAQLAWGTRMLRVLGCRSCHEENLQGANFIDDPKVAMLYAPNLTLVAQHATDAQLDRAIRGGVGIDGRALVIMPSESYQFLTDQESAAIIAALRAMPKVGSEQPKRTVGPLGRIGLVTGKFKTVPQLIAEYDASPLPDFGPKFAAGRHMVEIKCNECHGPKLKGQELEPGVVAPDLAIVGAYDLNQFKTLMRTEVPPSKKKLGLMAEVAQKDMVHLTDQEVADIHAYLVEHANRQP